MFLGEGMTGRGFILSLGSTPHASLWGFFSVGYTHACRVTITEFPDPYIFGNLRFFEGIFDQALILFYLKDFYGKEN